jgi:hypothetical protein
MARVDVEVDAVAVALLETGGAQLGAGPARGVVRAPRLYGRTIDSGSRTAHSGAYALAAVLIIVAALVTLFLGVDAERKPLEEVCAPLGTQP